MAALDKLNISTAFLDLDPENWPSSEDYLKGLEVVQNIKVTNDHAERGVALVQEFNRHITHDEDQLGTVPSPEWKPNRLTVCSNGMVFRSSTEIKPYGL